METKHFECSCSNFLHTIRFSWFQDEWTEKYGEKELYLEVHLNHYLPWYKRLYIAFCYLFKRKCTTGYTDVLFLKKDIKNLQNFLNNFDTSEDKDNEC